MWSSPKVIGSKFKVLVFFFAAISYAIDISWAAFFVASYLVISFFQMNLITLLISSVIVYCTIFYYGLPWWYMFLLGQHVIMLWEFRYISGKVQAGKLDKSKATEEFKKTKGISGIIFLIGFLGMIYQCIFG